MSGPRHTADHFYYQTPADSSRNHLRRRLASQEWQHVTQMPPRRIQETAAKTQRPHRCLPHKIASRSTCCRALAFQCSGGAGGRGLRGREGGG